MNLVNKIKQIGRTGICSDEDLHVFLPNLPVLSGSEFIFTISWSNSEEYIDRDVEDFIKGLHFIENKYKAGSNNDFGFGSPSPTYKAISSLNSKDSVLAKKLADWVLANGGNYYLKGK